MIGFLRRILGHQPFDHGKFHDDSLEVQRGRMELRNARARELAALSLSVTTSIDGLETVGVVERTVRDAMRDIEGRKNDR